MIHLSYNGENLGEFDESQISLMISDGRIDQNAYFWREGMEDWKPISDLEFSEQPTETDKKDGLPLKRDKNHPTKTQVSFLEKRGISVSGLNKVQAAELVSQTKEQESLQKLEEERQRDEENAKRKLENSKVTPKQLAYLDYHGIRYKKAINRAEASALIEKQRDRFRDSHWNRINHILYPDLYEYYGGSGRAQKEYEVAKTKLDQLKKSHQSSIEDIEEAIESLAEAKEALADDKLERSDTIDIWADDFSNDMYPNDPSIDMDQYFKVFKKPNKSQIKVILETFEDQYKFPSDIINVEQFFFIYYKLFPDSVKKGKKPRFSINQITVPKNYNGSSSANTSFFGGCLSLIFKIFIVGIIATIVITIIAALFSAKR
jgi:hypothetical protein